MHRDDPTCMGTLPVEAWFLLGAIAAALVLAALHHLARSVANAKELHDLRVEMAMLQIDYARRLRRLAARQEPEDDIYDVDIVEPEAEAPARAA